MSLPEKIRESVASAPGLVVAVSGGADSVALLRAVVTLPITGPIVAAHLNHRLRGEESEGDEQFVRDLAGHLGIKLAVAQGMPAGGNLEAVARRERYRFLTAVAREHGLAYVVTAHTANDQAETVLHRLLRGSGLQGLRGIAQARSLAPGITLLRPMLGVTRSEVLEYLREIGQEFREDSSNIDRRFTRNRIRHELLPLLTASYNPAVVPILSQLAQQAAELFDDVEQRAQELLRQCEHPPAGPLRILDVAVLIAAPRYLQREALRQLWQREDWPRDRMRFTEWDRLTAVIAGHFPAIDLPGRIHARRRGYIVQIGPS